MASRTVLLVTLLVALPAFASASAAGATHTLTGVERQVTADPGNQYDPHLSGNLAVFTDDRAGDLDVYYTDLSTGIESPVKVAPSDQELTDISGSRIAYTDYSTVDIHVLDVSTGIDTNLTAAGKAAYGWGYNAVNPSIDGDLVTWWQDRDSSFQIVARNLATGEERAVATADPGRVVERPDVGGSWITWEDCPSTLAGVCSIGAYDWATGETREVAAAGLHPRTDGVHVVYQAGDYPDEDLYAYDLATGTTQRLAVAGDQSIAQVSGDWVSYDTEPGDGLLHVGLWYLPTGESFRLDTLPGGPPSTAGQYLSDIQGNRVVYTDDRHGDLDIYEYTFQLHQSDTTPPAIVVPATVGVDATGPGGAAASYTVTVTDDTDPAPVWSCAPASGATFPIGDTTVACTATDASANTATATFVVHVRGAAEQLAALRTKVAALGLKPLVAASLDLELRAAQAALAAGRPKLACAALDLSAIEVRLLSPAQIHAADAADLMSAATRIRAVLGC